MVKIMDIGFICFIALILIFGCIFIFCLNLLFKKIVGVDYGFKELFDLYKAIKKIEIKRVVIASISLVVAILFIKILNLKFTVFNVISAVIVINSLFEIIVHKKLPSIISKNNLLWWISLCFFGVWWYFVVPKLLNYFEITNPAIIVILAFIVPIILLLSIALFIEF